LLGILDLPIVQTPERYTNKSRAGQTTNLTIEHLRRIELSDDSLRISKSIPF
jgi:hypothetical protein